MGHTSRTVIRILFSPRVRPWTKQVRSLTTQPPHPIATDPAWGAGTLVFSVPTGVNMPFDDLLYYVDGVLRYKPAAVEGCVWIDRESLSA